jgi:hypothetical protein
VIARQTRRPVQGQGGSEPQIRHGVGLAKCFCRKHAPPITSIIGPAEAPAAARPATVVTGVTVLVEEPARAIAIPEDAVFSALAALGYAFLFDVPARVAWVCVLCGIAGHTTRTLCVHLGIDIIGGTLIGALAAGFLAQGFARYFRASTAAFAFPGVVPARQGTGTGFAVADPGRQPAIVFGP